MTAVGGYLAKLLTEKGWSVYHDKGVYDLQKGKMDRAKPIIMLWKDLTRSWQNTRPSR